MSAPLIPRNEADVERYLGHRVGVKGGSMRKVEWQGRRSAPDQMVLLPAAGEHFMVECKGPGLAATFPKNAHERAQAREHLELRAAGVKVHIVDSYESVDYLLDGYQR